MGLEMQFPRDGLERVRRGARRGFALTVLASAVGCAGTQASMTPVQLSAWPGAQVFTQDTPVRGVAFNMVAGHQDDVAGLGIGLLNSIEKKFSGLWWGIMNVGHGNVRGFQCGSVNTADVSFAGLQFGIFNQADGEMRGAQVGGANIADNCAGFQLGVINTVDSTRCLQIGLINVNPSGFLPYFPIVLMGF